jgi:site-specific DNA recombinase
MKMAENVRVRRHGRNANAPSLLRGLLYDREGHRFTPSHTVKNGKRYRYYVLPHIAKDGPNDEPDRIPAQEIENLIISKLREFFSSPDQVMSSLARPGDDVAITRGLVQGSGSYAEGLNTTSAAQLNEMLTEIMLRATVLRDSVGIQFSHSAVRSQLLEEGEAPPDLGDERDWITLEVLAKLKRCGGETRLIIPGPAANDQRRRPIASLVKAVSRAYDWVRKIESGEFKDQRAIATAYGINERYISHILPGAFLAPTIVEAILEGKHSPDLSLNTLLKDLPLSWTEQHLGN